MCKNIHRYFTDISDISVKSNYRYIRVYRYFDPWRGKLSPRFIEPFEILDRIGTIAYRLVLPPSMSGVHEVFHVSMLRKYTPNPAHVVDWGQIEVDTDGTFEEGPVCILDSRDQVLRRKTVRLVRVLWRHYGVEESTWEREDTMRATYPFLFRDEGTWFSRLKFK